MTDPTSPSVTLGARVRKMDGAIRTLFGEGSSGQNLLKICQDATRDLRDIDDQRGIPDRIITVLGHKNAGKSTLCSLLVKDSNARKRIQSGLGSDNATRKITWIGPVSPDRFEHDSEIAIAVPRDRMAELEVPYTLVDVPGYTDAEENARNAASRILRMASTVVLVTSWGSLEDESALTYLHGCDGAHIIPVVVDDKYATRKRDDKRESELDDFRRSVEKWCPGSEVAYPIVLPKIDAAPEDKPEKKSEWKDLVRDETISALKKATSAPPDPQRLAFGRYNKFVGAIRRGLMPFLSNINPHYEKLLHQEEEAARDIAEQLIGNERQLRCGTRVRMLADVANSSPALFFPYRSFLGLLTLTSGAWDRMMLTLFGSSPSLVMVILQSAKNVRSLQELRQKARDALQEQAASLASGHLASVNQVFLRSVRQNLPPERQDQFPPEFKEATLRGLEEMEAETRRIFEDGVKEHRANAWLPWGIGLLAMVIWFLLAAGPVWAVYREFLSAWKQAFGAAGSASWQVFPVPSASMLFATLILVFGPVFLLAMVSLCLSVTRKRVDECVKSVRANTDIALDGFISAGLIRLQTDDEMRDAVRLLLRECRSDADNGRA